MIAAQEDKTKTRTINIDGREIGVNGERNLLEVIRKAGIDLPTFCYHSDLSVYGACRLCLVDVQGRGISGACSTPAEPGLTVRTQTAELREIRKIAIELLLANHDQQCPTCPKSGACQLQEVARKLGIRKVRFKPVHEPEPLDETSVALIRDPNKCVLCGDCVRFCEEIQSVGAIDFAYRGQKASVLPAFGAGLGKGECVHCGQCAAACPTGALTPRPEMDEVWRALHDAGKTVVAQVAPAVRVAIGEAFGLAPGAAAGGLVAAALKRLGFDRVYDTSFSADLTVIEEATEFLERKAKGERLPQFTSCCPGWVKFAEQFYPDLLGNLSTCKSPQQMLGALCKALLPAELGIARQDLVVVSIMPCTAKKFEARRPEFAADGVPDVDHVLTTQELARMIEGAGIRFQALDAEPFDMPMGFKTGAGLIFGNSGGVSEAVLRYAAGKIAGRPLAQPEFQEVRGQEGLRVVRVPLGETELKIGVVHGLANGRTLAEQVRRGECELDLIEVMACPGGCVGGGGQPVSRDAAARRDRTRGLYEADRQAELHSSQENHCVADLYDSLLGEVGGERAHHLLHTGYQNRRRIDGSALLLGEGGDAEARVKANICVGTNCFLKGSQAVLHDVLEHVEAAGLRNEVEVSASFCFERCEQGPTGEVEGRILPRCTSAGVCGEVHRCLEEKTGSGCGKRG